MGSRGPIPKRSSERLRARKSSISEVVISGPVQAPEPDEAWHEIARDWFVALGKSAQSRFYEPSDWAAAVLVAETMTRYLRSKYTSPPLFAALWSAMGDLLTTEGERRRVRIEVNRRPDLKPVPPSAEDELARYRDL